MISIQKSLFCIISLIYLLLEYTVGKDIIIFESQNEISFAQIKDFTIDISKLDKTNQLKNDNLKYYVSIYVNVTLSEECIKNSKNCGHPVRIYGKKNEEPKIDTFNFDKKDDHGKFNGNYKIYGFEYSPCNYVVTDILHIKVVGVEGRSNFTLKAYLNHIPEYKVLCTKGIIPTISSHYSAVSTPKGKNINKILNSLI